ncbi:hypothetical protein PoB_004248300 [Plakobranchus ocellatus]|uniref:G-protein coupled receptors family 1 profile domain-containing protein n=1 Tax=Plakobranchus ocellatus TaxID=259542 RepID=A0AAV4B9Z4_9GAST|nr:hypothetical protein PoB_004248300 [Plakobranchus ocellatus]
MRTVVFVSLEFVAVFLNIAFAFLAWTHNSVGAFLRWILMGLVFVNLLTNAQCMTLDLSMAAGIYLGWPVCITQFINAPFCIYATLTLVTIINIERIVAVKWPLQYPVYFTPNKAVATVFSVLTLAMGLSLLGLPDILHQYEMSSGICLPSDLYPKRYSLILISAICTFLLVVVVASFLLNVRLFMTFTHQKILRLANVSTEGASKLKRRAIVASRIACASAFFYSWTIGFLVSFLFWVMFTNCDDVCLSEGKFAYAAAIAQLLVTMQDPLIFFISIAKWPSLSWFLWRLCRIQTNQVTPSSTEDQPSPQVEIEPVPDVPLPRPQLILNVQKLTTRLESRDATA